MCRIKAVVKTHIRSGTLVAYSVVQSFATRCSSLLQLNDKSLTPRRKGALLYLAWNNAASLVLAPLECSFLHLVVHQIAFRPVRRGALFPPITVEMPYSVCFLFRTIRKEFSAQIHLLTRYPPVDVALCSPEKLIVTSA